jgi:surfactin synthase thioesterase subunit
MTQHGPRARDERVAARAGGWLLREPAEDAPARLFCFPFAGVGASAFRRWPRRIGPLDVCPVQLPGRENRMRERSYRTVRELVAAAASALLPYLDVPFAVLGHSMGARLAYALVVELEERGLPAPARLYVSASLVPHAGGFFGPFRPSTTDAELGTALRKLIHSVSGQEPIPDLLALAVRILRADLEMSFRYWPYGPRRLPCPITTLVWLDYPDVLPEQMQGWCEYGDVSRHTLSGDSLDFLNPSRPLLAAIETDFRRAYIGRTALKNTTSQEPTDCGAAS